MKRKIIQLAGKTLVVSLPHTWAKTHHVTKGAEVEVTEETQGLCIHPSTVQEKKNKTIDVRLYDEETVKSVLSVLHKLGYDAIEVLCEEKQQPVVLERIKTNLMGFEVVQQSAKKIVIQNITGDADTSFDMLVRRVFLVTLELARGVEEAFLHNKPAHTLLSLEETNNKLTNYCHRLLLKKPTTESLFLYVLLWLQEKIADDYRDIIKNTKRTKITREMQETAQQLRLCTEEFYATVYACSLENIMHVREHIQRVQIRGADPISQSFEALKQHITDGLGSLTARYFVREQASDLLNQKNF